MIWDDTDDLDESEADVFVALRPYEAQVPGELSFEEGDAIVVIAMEDDGEWMTGTLNGRTGRFPASYVGTQM